MKKAKHFTKFNSK